VTNLEALTQSRKQIQATINRISRVSSTLSGGIGRVHETQRDTREKVGRILDGDFLEDNAASDYLYQALDVIDAAIAALPEWSVVAGDEVQRVT
tara:strand:+ start:10289 stop:10570 length:282 start_codon:yes stop_codon:yes gene_type:complete